MRRRERLTTATRQFLPVVLIFAGMASSGALRSVPARAEVTLTLVHEVELGTFGGTDCWGWTAPDSTHYAIMGTSTGLAIVNAVTGQVVDTVPGPTQWCSSYWRDMVAWGHHLYCVTECYGDENGMMIVDLQYLPDSAHDIGSWHPSGQETSHNMTIDSANGTAYAVKRWSSGLRALDLSDLENPVDVPLFVGLFAPTALHDMYARNDTVWGAEASTGRFSIWDMTNKSHPATLATFAPAGAGYAHNIWPTDDGRHVLTTEETANKSVKIWNVEDMNNVQLRGQYLAPNRLAHNVQVWGDYAYISHYESGVVILDISNPSFPNAVASYDTWPASDNADFNGCWGVFEHTRNGMVYASNDNGRLFILQSNIVHTDFEATPTVVTAGTPVEFRDISPTISSGWTWDLGDGDTAVVARPVHLYSPGIYDVGLTANTPSAGDGYAFKPQFITVLAETLSSASIELLRDTDAYWEISCSNNVPLAEIVLPVTLSDVPGVCRVDSISIVGCRTAYFELNDLVYDNRFAGELAVRLRADNGGGAPPLPPGGGPVARVHVRTSADAPIGGICTMSTDSLWVYGLEAVTTTTTFVPAFTGGTLTIGTPEIGDLNHDGEINVLDVIFLIDYVFRSGAAAEPESLGDTTCDGPVDVLDVTLLIDFVFRSGSAPCS